MKTRSVLLGLLFIYISEGVFISKAQENNVFVVLGEIASLKDGTKVTLFKGDMLEQVFSKGGKFHFQGKVSVNGETAYLKLDEKEECVNLILEKGSKLTVTCNLSEWPNCDPTGSKAQAELNDFQNNIQRPFNKALKKANETLNRLTGSKDYTRIPSTLSIEDSLRTALAIQTYKKEPILYSRNTMNWICTHLDALYAPALAMVWWPREGRALIYNAFTSEVKESHYGQKLKKMIKNLP